VELRLSGRCLSGST